MDEFYNKHYITTDARSRITDGWSDGPHPEKDAASSICINEQGGYQFRLVINGQPTQENPPLFDWDAMIPLYKWDGVQVQLRTAEELDADRAALPQPAVTEPDVTNPELASAIKEGVDSL